MTKEPDFAEDSIEENIDENEELTEEITSIENLEFEDEDSKTELPIGYERKLGEENDDEIEESFL